MQIISSQALVLAGDPCKQDVCDQIELGYFDKLRLIFTTLSIALLLICCGTLPSNLYEF